MGTGFGFAPQVREIDMDFLPDPVWGKGPHA
jgi:hypothetical protein